MKKLHLNWLRGGGALRRVGLVLVLCLIGVGQMWGSISFTVGVTGTGSSESYNGSDYNKMKLNAQFRWDNTEKGWITNTMSKAGMTFEGLDLYITSMTYDDAIQTNHMQFQKYKDNYQVYSWDAYSGKKEGSYWDTYIVAYGGSPYSRVSVSSGAKFYFDASNWSQTAIKLVAGHANHQQYYSMTNVTGTKLYYLSTSSYSNAMGIGVVGNSTRSGSNNQWLTDVSSHASEYTGWKHYGLTSTGANNAYLMVNNGATGEEPSMHYNASYSTLLNSTQTYNTVVKTIGGSYTSGNSKSTISISSYELTSQGETTNRTPTLSTSESSETVSACRTATTRLQVGTPATGYQFDGWYTAATSGSKISDNTDYTYYPTGANTYYARFSEIARTVTVAYKCGSTTIQSSGSVTNVGVTTAKNATAPDITGYTFSTWSDMPSGVTTSSSLTSSTISINASAGSQTITANYTLNSHTLTWNLDGGTVVTAGTGAAVNATGTPSSSVNYGASITAPVPQKDGYTFTGWNTTPATTMPDNDLTYTAQWTEITHTVSFANDGNGTTTPSSDQTVGEVTGVAINASNSTGYTFNTWTSSNGGSFASAATTASNTFYPTDGDATLTASFSPKQYNITLSALSDQVGGGESTTEGSAKVTYMGTTLTNISAPTRPGYEVDYYTRLANGNDKITTNNTGTLTALSSYVSDQGKWIYDNNLTLYAHWVPRTYTITLDANRGGISGTDGSTSFTVTSGANNFDFDPSTEGRQSMTPPTKEGYTFAGYYDDPDDGEGTKVINADGSKPATSYVNSDGNWINSDDDLTLYAHWTDNHIYYYNGATADGWSTASNWTKGAVPASDGSNTIHILKPLVISSDKKVAAVDIITSGTYTPTGGSAIDASGKLTINPNVGLNVTGTVTRTADATSNLATREGDLVLESSSAGNASLIFDNSYSCQATVQMYSKASISGSTWNWQYVGTPFTGSIPLYNYYGSWMYKWNNGGWDVVKGSDELTPFAGYCLTQESATTHVMGGTLVPTTSKSVTMSASTDMVLANSWTAPIYIGGFKASTFTSTPATIYLFNTGMAENGSSVGSEAGTYVAIPIFTTPYVGGGLIAPMQGFFVTTNGGSAGTITMNYADLVRPADSRSIVAGPMYAPKRAEEGDEPVLQDQPEEAPTVLKIWANGSVYNDRLVILAREDFSEGFDNGWDGSKMSFGSASPSVYVINAQGGYDAVSAIPNLEGTVIGFRAGEDKVCTMTFDYNGEEIWYLNDLQEQRSTEINSEINYQFTTSAGDSEVRFIVSKTPINHMPTGIEEISDQNSVVRKQMIDDKLYIIRGGRIYSAQGALVK